MSNELINIPSGDLQAYQEAFGDVDFAKKNASESLKRISIKGSTFRLVDGKQELQAIEDRAIKLIIINASPRVQREFYATEFKEGQDSEMVCWSNDGDTPAADAYEPQSQACATCPKNQKGSGPGGNKACRFAVRLAVVLANNPEGDILQLKLPAKSIFGTDTVDGDRLPFLAYQKKFSAANIPLQAAVTEAKFNTNASVPTLTFKAVAPLASDMIPIIRERSMSEAAQKLVKLTPGPRKVKDDMPEAEAEKKAPAPAKAAAKPAKAAGNAAAAAAWADDN